MSRLMSFFMTVVALLLVHSLNVLRERVSARRARPVVIGRPVLR